MSTVKNVNINGTVSKLSAGVYDVSEQNNGKHYSGISDVLSQANTDIPTNDRFPGMQIKFIQTTPSKYTVVKTDGIVEQPAGTEIQSNSGVNSGTYEESQLSVAFSSLPDILNSSITYYLTVTETVDEQEVTTYTTWKITLVQSSDNSYVQYRLMSDSFNTTVANWEGVDEEPTAGSVNLVQSGGTLKAIQDRAYTNEIANGSVEAGTDTSVTSTKVITLTDMEVGKTYLLKVSVTEAPTRITRIKLRKSGVQDYEEIGYIKDGETFAQMEFSPLESCDAIRVAIMKEDNNGATYTASLLVVPNASVNDINRIVSVEQSRAEAKEGELEESIGSLSSDLDDVKDDVDEANGILYGSSHEVTVDISNLATINAYIDYNGSVTTYSSYRTTVPYAVKAGDVVNASLVGSQICCIGVTQSSIISAGDTVTPKVLANKAYLSDYTYTVEDDCYIVISYKNSDGLTASLVTSEHDDGLVDKVEENEAGISELDGRVSALEGGGSINGCIDTGVLLQRKNIKDNWPYYLSNAYDKKGQQDFVDPVSYASDSYLEGKIRSVPKGRSFIFVTDTHLDRNVGNSNYLIDYVRKRLGIKNVAFGGDCLTEETSEYMAALALSKYADEFFATFGKDGIWVQGNHDANHGNNPRTANDEIFNRTVGLMDNSIVFDDFTIDLLSRLELSEGDYESAYWWMHMHYYYDDVVNKTRYIVLETGDGSAGKVVLGLTNDWATQHIQLDFVAKSLLSLPSGYNVVVIGHKWSGDWKYLPNQAQRRIPELLSAYKSKSTFTITKTKWGTGETDYANAWELWQLQGGETHSYDFSDASPVGTPVYISGHWHVDDAFVCQTKNGVYVCEEYDDVSTFSDDAVLCIWTSCDMYPASTYPNDGELTHVVKPDMHAGTVSEQAFDVVTIDGDTIVCTRFGAGDNRTFEL